MSQLIRSFLIGRPRFGSIFWWLLSSYFLRPLSVEIVVFDLWIMLIFYTKTCFRRPLSHSRGFLISHKTSRNRVSLALRIICGVFFFALVSFRIVKNCENTWKHSVFGIFCSKRRTVAQKSSWWGKRETVVRKRSKTFENQKNLRVFDEKKLKIKKNHRFSMQKLRKSLFCFVNRKFAFVKSLFCFVFRTSVFQKRRTVAHFGREIIVLLCVPDISVPKT